MNDKVDECQKMLAKLNVPELTSDEKDLRQKKLMKRCMQKWLPGHLALLEMMVLNLPSPKKAQKYRVENLYEGPLDDIYAAAIRDCDPNGPLCLYVSKMVPTGRPGSSY